MGFLIVYDIIGDIHGHADELKQLLERLGYNWAAGYYSHPTREVVFVGDFIDRGPQIAEVLRIVRPMIDSRSAHAVMGNHEFNAIAYHTCDPVSNQFLRVHSEKNNRQHSQTLRQLSTAELHGAIEWFRTLPMSLELCGIRVAHACWDITANELIEASLQSHGGVTLSFMQSATDNSRPLFHAVEDVLKGKELQLPKGSSFRDKDGQERTKVRVRWFEHPAGKTFRQYALPASDEIPDKPVPESAADAITPYHHSAPPIFVGHYWLKAARPSPFAPNVACVDYSVAKGGSLCAYRWNGEAELLDENFVTVEARY